jgi:hypothetical protein
MIPSSFCTICTKQCKQELVGFLLSLSIHHENANVYVMCDTETKQTIDILTPKPRLNIKWYITLDKYSELTRSDMELKKIFGKFLENKMDIMLLALNENPDTVFLDSDTIILDTINDIDNNKELGLSPQFIRKENVDETGYYNAGLVWTNNIKVCKTWKSIIDHNNSCAEQINMKDLTKEYDYFEFGENYNLQTWRFLLGLESTEKIASYVNVKKNKLYYKDKPLKFIHTHFNSPRFQQINNFFIQKMCEAKLYKELLCVFRLINERWILSIPKQPLKGMGNHKDDSYRELPLLMKIKNKDVDLKFKENSIHCWLEPNILLYDRPTLEWCNNELSKSSLLLLGNGSMVVEGKILQDNGLKVIPWIFWPRRPMIVEKLLKKNGIFKYSERKTNCIFIGNFENSTQQKFRKTNHNWESVLDVYHCTEGQKHKFTQEEYLMQLRNSKYGLCLRGYGSKCHREVELMAFGTVPIVTPEVSIKSYMEAPIENIHYIKVTTPEELKDKINAISQKKWEAMSKSCYEWYQRNVHSDNCWNNMINNILYTSKTIYPSLI